MESPCTLLALFAAVFGSSASATLGKLTSVLFPLTALVVGTLTDASTGVVLAAEISHDHASPVLHISAVVADCELLNEREKVEVVVEQILFVIGVLVINLRNFILLIHSRRVLVNGGKLLANLEARDKVTLLEIRAKTTVFRDVSKELQRHEHILLPRHGGNHLRVRNKIAVEKISRDGSSSQRRLRRRSHGRAVRGQSNGGNRSRVVVHNATVQRRAMVNVECTGFLVSLGNCGRGQVESCATKHGVAVFHSDILDTNSGLQIIGARHLRLG
jgi:hypothetical protein